ncbi:P-loop containing nucleoside triphosphate hydrolase protein [Lipomyces tetrasporus]
MSTSRRWETLSPALTPWLLETVRALGYANMTPVQASTIPLFCSNKDVVVEAVTGSGKTISFLIPTIEIILRAGSTSRGRLGGIIVAPTRELASQIYAVLNSVLEFQPTQPTESTILKAQLLIGGSATVASDVQKFFTDSPQIIVGTPGRLLEFLGSPHVQSSGLEVLVLDEADRLLDLGFDKTISGILRCLPKQRRTGLFSATVTSAVGELVRVGLRNPIKIIVKVGDGEREQKVPTTLSISYSVLTPDSKIPSLIHKINTLKYKKAIVYFPTCASVVFFYTLLRSILPKLQSSKSADAQVFSLHGKLPQGPRTKTLNSFINTMKKSVLLTTDVAARGLDIPEVDVVIQIDPPYEADMFLHRAGRAARAGRYGEGYLFLTKGREEGYVDLMEVKKVRMHEAHEIELSGLKAEFHTYLRDWILDSREKHDMAVKAYVSYVRFYTKHTMTSIFRMNEFDFVGFGRAYGLLRLPSMPELKSAQNIPENGWLTKDIDMDAYKYKDPQRERARQEELSNRAAKSAAKHGPPKPANKSWSEQSERRERREHRREMKRTKKESKAVVTENGESASDNEEMEEDWKTLIADRKKKRKANISEMAFDL